MYLTYTEYQSMGGTLAETTFNEFEFKSETLINYATFNRLMQDTTIPVAVKKLTKHIVDTLQKQVDSMNLGQGSGASNDAHITSQSNDGVSISYNGMPATELYEACDAEIQKSIKLYLNGVTNTAGRNLLYRGLYRGE